MARPSLVRLFFYLVAPVLVATLLGCDPDDPVVEPPLCASFDHLTATPSLSSEVMPIFQMSCNFSSCHTSASPNPQGGLALGPPGGEAVDPATVAEVHAGLLGADAMAADAKLVVAGAPEASFLVAKLLYGDDASFRACGFDCTDCGALMPVGHTSPMDAERIDTIAAWIKNGAKHD